MTHSVPKVNLLRARPLLSLTTLLVACSGQESTSTSPNADTVLPDASSAQQPQAAVGTGGRMAPAERVQDAAAQAAPGSTLSWTEDPNRIDPAVRDRACMDALVVDIDQDGDVDVVLAIEFGPNAVLLNDGSGQLRALSRFPATSRDSEDVVALDSDGDGDLDLLFVSEDDQTNELMLNTGSLDQGLSFELAPTPLPALGISNGATTLDVNGDGLLDVAIANAGPNFLFVNGGDGTFEELSGDYFPSNDATSQDIEVGDVDGDGDLDLLWGNEGQNELWLWHNERYVDASIQLPSVNDETRELDLADVDGDGDLDIVVANVQLFTAFSPDNAVWLNDGTGQFLAHPGAIPPDGLSSFDVDLADLDGDGIADLVTANWQGTGPAPFRIHLGQGDGSFLPLNSTSLPADEAGLDVEVADFNGDGRADLYLCSRGGFGPGNRRDHLLLGQ